MLNRAANKIESKRWSIRVIGSNILLIKRAQLISQSSCDFIFVTRLVKRAYHIIGNLLLA